MNIDLDIGELLGRRILLIGDVGSGKTRYTAYILKRLLDRGYSDDITVIDLAPEAGDIGLPLERYIDLEGRVRYLKPIHIYPPRLRASSIDELISFIKYNYRESRKLFNIYRGEPTSILVVNDVSIFLHYGEVGELMDYIKLADTFLGNAYYGTSLVDHTNYGLDNIERSRVEELINYMDRVIEMRGST